MLIKCIDDIALATLVNVKQERWKKRGRKKLRKTGKVQVTLKSVYWGTREDVLRPKISWAKAFHKRFFDDVLDIFIIFFQVISQDNLHKTLRAQFP